MKRIIYLILFSALFVACESKPAKLTSSSNAIDTVSFAMGVSAGHSVIQNFEEWGIPDPNYDLFIAGMQHVLNNDSTKVKLDNPWAMGVIQQYFTERQRHYSKENYDFLENNKKNEGIITLESGLQYKVIKEGSGISPEISDTIHVKYSGSLINGSVFDKSGSATDALPLNQMIPGWKEGLPLMKEGAKYIFYIPSVIGYGQRGAGSIPPESTLIFEVELFKVTKGLSN